MEIIQVLFGGICWDWKSENIFNVSILFKNKFIQVTISFHTLRKTIPFCFCLILLFVLFYYLFFKQTFFLSEEVLFLQSLFILLFIVCMRALAAEIYIHLIYFSCLWKSENGMKCSGNRAKKNSCESPCRCRELNLNPLVKKTSAQYQWKNHMSVWEVRNQNRLARVSKI